MIRPSRAAAILLLQVLAACGAGVTDNTPPATTTLTLLPSRGTVMQGGSTSLLATLTKGADLTGPVNLAAASGWSSIHVTSSAVQTDGQRAFATFFIAVDIGTGLGHYDLTVHGTGSGGADLTATFGFDVTPAPASYTMTVSPVALTSAQGASATATVTLARVNMDGPIALSVDNLPPGVTASFAPPAGGNASVLTLTVAGSAPTGSFTNLAVRGATQDLFHLADIVVPISLTITGN